MATYTDIFKIKHNNIAPEKGKILISEPFLQDSCFQRSVVLLIEHDKNGSMGLVLNKKTDFIVNSFFPELRHFPEMPIYLGGPVSSNRLYFLHSLGKLIPDTVQINDHLYFDGDFNAIKSYILRGNSVEGKIKFFIGYSGWTEGQLLTEIRHDSWLVSNTASKEMFEAEDEKFWKNSLIVLGSPYETWQNYPKDPEMN